MSIIINSCLNGRKTSSLLFLLTFAVIGFFETAVNCSAQQPFQDARGESTIFIDNAQGSPVDGFVQINVADPSITLSFLRDFSDEKYSFGMTLKGKLTGDRATLIGDNKIAPDAQLKFSVGKKYLTTKKLDLTKIIMTKGIRDEIQRLLIRKEVLGSNTKLPDPLANENIEDYIQRADPLQGKDLGEILSLREFRKYANFDRLIFQGGYSFNQYNLYDAALPFSDQVYKKKFHNPSAELIYFRQLNGRNLVGASVGVKRANNVEDLTEIEVRDFIPTVNGGTTREVGKTKKALRGDFKQYTTSYINTDYVWFPKPFGSRIGLNFFTRSQLLGVNKGIKPGIGLFITKENYPTRIVGGASVSESGGKFSFALTAGYNF